MAPADEPPRRSIHFAGRHWWVKRASEPVGPGPNSFDDTTEAVQVDADGSLSLRIHQTRGRWTCAEVIGEDVTGHGTYEWTVRTDLSDLDRHVVCGMFTWSDEPAHFHRELDIEVSAWGRTDGVTGQFVVQPWAPAGHRREFAVPRIAPWPCSFHWAPSGVTFRAVDGPPWTFTGAGVPPQGGVHPRLNLWLYRGAAPHADGAIQVRFGDFRFTPLAG
jgi:hypothetical protein